MDNNEIEDILWDEPTQNKAKLTQVRLRLSQENIEFLQDLEAAGVDRNSAVNLALSLMKPKCKNYNFKMEGIVNYIKK
jgi:hypothetical protein